MTGPPRRPDTVERAAPRRVALAAAALLTACAGTSPASAGTPTATAEAAAAPAAAGTVPAAAAGARAEGRRVVRLWMTSADRSRLLSRAPDLVLAPVAGHAVAPDIEVDPARRYQTIDGFGAALTDASATVLQDRLTAAGRRALLAELFGPSPGLGLKLLRLPIGASDFSSRRYTYDDLPAGATDPELRRFSIAPDRAARLPVIRQILAIDPRLELIASPWSAPAWMKTSGSLIGGTLRPGAYAAYARYLVRFVDAYAAAGVPIFALTVQNEPGFTPKDYPGMRLGAAQRARLVGEDLGPLLRERAPRTRILEWDHNWDRPESPLAVLSNARAARYVAGIAWHCYEGDPAAQGRVHAAFPDRPAYLTECSGGEWQSWGGGLIWMSRTLIVDAERQWARGVLLWNLALDEHHGPHQGGCTNCLGVVTIDSATGAVTRNAEWYVLAQASRFVRPGAVRIDSGPSREGLRNVAFRNADGTLVLIAVNDTPAPQPFTVRQGGDGFASVLPPLTVATFVWR